MLVLGLLVAALRNDSFMLDTLLWEEELRPTKPRKGMSAAGVDRLA